MSDETTTSDDDVAPEGDSRRDALKKLGIGAAGAAAAAWAAPSILSIDAASAATGAPIAPCVWCGTDTNWVLPSNVWLPLTAIEQLGLIPGCAPPWAPLPPVETITDIGPGAVNINLPPGPESCDLPPLLPSLPNASAAIEGDLGYLAWLFDPQGPPPALAFGDWTGCDGATFTVDGVVNAGGDGLYTLLIFTDGTNVIVVPYSSFPPPDPSNPPPLTVPVPAGAIGFLGLVVANTNDTNTYDVDITFAGITDCP